MAEAVAALHHLDAAAPHHLVGRKRLHFGAVEHDRALGDLAALGVKQIGDRLERGGLAGAVGAEERHNAAVRHRQRHALEHENDAVVDDLDIVEGENGRGAAAPAGADFIGVTAVMRRCPPRTSVCAHEIITREASGAAPLGVHDREATACVQLTTTCRKARSASASRRWLLRSSSAALSISGRTLSLIGSIDGTFVFHFVPSHSTSEMPL